MKHAVERCGYACVSAPPFAKKHKIFTFYLPALILVAALTLTACGGGQICFKGEDITRARGRRRKQLRRQMQMIF